MSTISEDSRDLTELLKIEVPEERVERIKKWYKPDVGDDVPQEVIDYLIKQQARFVNIQYLRFLAGVKFSPNEVDKLLEGGIDCHAHGGSEPFERIALEDEIAIDYNKAGFKAVVFKTWYTPSASRNALVQKAVDQWAREHELEPIKVIGGITLNQSVGGINPDAVKKCLGFPNFKYVWMPMVDSYHHRRLVYDDQSGSGIRFLDGNGKVIDPMIQIIEIIAENDLVLASGHYPAEDTYHLFEEATKRGVKHFEVVHPAHIHSKHSIAQMKDLAQGGAKLMLSGLGTLAFPLHETGPAYAARIVKEVGADNLVYGSDFGQIHNPRHIVGTRWMVQVLLAYGVSRDEIRKIFVEAPTKHLGLL